MKGLVTILLGILVLAGCENEDSRIRGQFISNCVKSGADKDTCTCAYDYMEDKHGKAKLRELNKPAMVMPDGLVQELVKAAAFCQPGLMQWGAQDFSDGSQASGWEPIGKICPVVE